MAAKYTEKAPGILGIMALLLVLLALLAAGCGATQGSGATTGSSAPEKKFTEQDVKNSITGLFNAINSGDAEELKKYINASGPVAEKLVEKLKNNIKLTNIRDVSLQGTNAQATVTLEVVPLNVKRDITLDFDITNVLLLDNPLGLLTLLL